MKKRKGFISITRKGIVCFAFFWAFVGLFVFGVPEEWSIGKSNIPEEMVEGGLTIHFIDVGQADAAVILCGGEVMMIDGGNAEDSSLIYSYLKNTLGIAHIDCMIATHPHEDHIGGLSGALNACTVGAVYSPVTEYAGKAFESLKKYAERQGKTLTIPAQGQKIRLGGAEAQFMSLNKQYDDINDQSIVVRIEFGKTSILFMGDAEWEAEHDLIESGYDLRSTLLKVGHHGSSSSSAYVFLREVMPDYAVISVGADNSYGHPTEAALSRLRDVGAQIVRTDQSGHIVVSSDGRTLSFTTQKGNAPVMQAGENRQPLDFGKRLEELAWELLNFSKERWEDLISWASGV